MLSGICRSVGRVDISIEVWVFGTAFKSMVTSFAERYNMRLVLQDLHGEHVVVANWVGTAGMRHERPFHNMHEVSHQAEPFLSVDTRGTKHTTRE